MVTTTAQCLGLHSLLVCTAQLLPNKGADRPVACVHTCSPPQRNSGAVFGLRAVQPPSNGRIGRAKRVKKRNDILSLCLFVSSYLRSAATTLHLSPAVRLNGTDIQPVADPARQALTVTPCRILECLCLA